MILSHEIGKEKNVKFIYVQQVQLESQSNKSFIGQQLVDLENDLISSTTKCCLTFRSKAFKTTVWPHFQQADNDNREAPTTTMAASEETVQGIKFSF